jgi:hypothetical protein
VARDLFEPLGSGNESDANELLLESSSILRLSHGNYFGLVAGDLSPQDLDIPAGGQGNDFETVGM